MRYTLLLPLAFLFCCANLCSQTIDFQNYTGLYSAGNIPADFTKLSSENMRKKKKILIHQAAGGIKNRRMSFISNQIF
jgi:hypothetical protein